MNNRKAITESNIGEVATMVEFSIKGQVIKATDVAELLDQAGYQFDDPTVVNVRAYAKELRKKFMIDIVRQLGGLLPFNPSKTDVDNKVRQMGRELTEFQVKNIYKALKVQHPRLFNKFETIPSDQYDHALLEIRSKFDYMIVQEIAKCVGISDKEAVSLVLRVFVQAYSIHHIDLVKLVQLGMSAGDLQIAPLLKMLRDLDLSRVVKKRSK